MTSSLRPAVSGTGTAQPPITSMTHLAVSEGEAEWGDHVTAEEYRERGLRPNASGSAEWWAFAPIVTRADSSERQRQEGSRDGNHHSE